MSDTLVKVENVSKKFCRSLKKSLWYGMQDLGNELLGRRHGGNGELRPDEFWAVRDVSFELKRGIRLRQKQPLDRSLFPVEARPVFFDCLPFSATLGPRPVWD